MEVDVFRNVTGDDGIDHSGVFNGSAPHTCKLDFVEIVIDFRVANRHIRWTWWNWIWIRYRCQVTLRGSRNFGRGRRGYGSCRCSCSRGGGRSAIIFNVFRIEVTQLVDTDCVRRTTLALGAEFPDSVLLIDARHCQICRTQILPGCQRCSNSGRSLCCSCCSAR